MSITMTARGIQSARLFHRPRNCSETDSRHEVRSTALASTTLAISGPNIPIEITQLYSGCEIPSSRIQNGRAHRARNPVAMSMNTPMRPHGGVAGREAGSVREREREGELMAGSSQCPQWASTNR